MYPAKYGYRIPGRFDLGPIARQLANETILAIDTETTGLDPLTDKLACLQVATPDYCYVIPATFDLSPLKPVLENPDDTLLLQYAPFDYGFLLQHAGIDISKATIYDTRAAELAMNPGGHSSLAYLHKKYIGTELDKGPRLTFEYGVPITDVQARYAAIDALCLFPIALRQGLWAHRHDQLQMDRKLPFRAMEDYLNGTGPFPAKV